MKQEYILNGRKVELDEDTIKNKKLLDAIKYAHANRGVRVRVWYGDTKTGESWNDEHDVMGYVSNSTGEKACLILVPNIRSFGGGAILDHSIVRIDDIKNKKPLYIHEDFHCWLKQVGKIVVSWKTNVTYAKFDSAEKAKRYVQFMRGERYKK